MKLNPTPNYVPKFRTTIVSNGPWHYHETLYMSGRDLNLTWGEMTSRFGFGVEQRC